nr:gustatory receptor for sugar taste 64f-like [Leptinotarsa decemlineata]
MDTSHSGTGSSPRTNGNRHTVEIETDMNSKNLILKSKMDSNTFQSVMDLPLRIAQCFGFFPTNIVRQTRRSMKIRWFHWQTIYSFLTFMILTEETIKAFYVELPRRHNIFTIDVLIFHSNSVIQFILLFKLSLDWPSYVKEWHKIERKCWTTVDSCSNLKRKINSIVLSILIIATVEHFLIAAYILKTSMERSSTVAEGFKTYFLRSYRSAFTSMDYSLWKGVILEFINLQMAFIWNYIDIFIMVIGATLKYRMRQVTHRVEMLAKSKVNQKHAWKVLRNDYLQVVSLCCSTNKRISPMIITSFTINLYFILKQIFRNLIKMDSTLERTYFHMSFGLLIIRIFCVIIYGSGVHDEWMDIRQIIHNVSTSAFNIEVERFISNISSYELVLSGKNFFGIRRGLILQIAGTIVTYELVLIQFNMGILKQSNIGP